MANPQESKPPTFSYQQWIESIFLNSQVDGAVAEGWNPLDTIMSAEMAGTTFEEQEDKEHKSDPGVAAKNRFLGFLATLSDGSKYHTGDLLGLLDRQSVDTPDPNETRYRQFMGLWDLVVALSKDQDIIEQLRTQY